MANENEAPSMAEVMLYVAEQFDKIRGEMCEGFDKIERRMVETQSDFVRRGEFDNVVATVRAEFRGLFDLSKEDRGNLSRRVDIVERDMSEISKLVYKAVGIGVIAGIALGGLLSAVINHFFK